MYRSNSANARNFQALLLTLALSVPGIAASPLARAVTPDDTHLQWAGNIGFFSLGIGYRSFEEHWRTQLFYGYVPTSLGGVSIHTLSLKTGVYSQKLELTEKVHWAPIYGGVQALVALGSNYFLIIPDRFRNYYWPSALRIAPFLGTQIEKQVRHGIIRRYQVYVEMGTVDVIAMAYLNNDSLPFEGVMDIGLGMGIGF